MSPSAWRLRTFWAVAKRWSLRAITATALASVGIRLGVAGMVTVPGRRGVESLVWPLAGGLTAITVAAVGGALLEVRELLAARSGLAQRTLFIAVVTATVTLAAVFGGPAVGSTVRLRNDLGLLGVALVSVTLLPRTAAWLPTAVIVVVIWFFGPVGGGRAPHFWAVLLRDQRDVTATIVTMTLGIGGVLTFLAGRPGRVRSWLLDA